MSQPKKSVIEVRAAAITILSQPQSDLISFTDIARFKDKERTDDITAASSGSKSVVGKAVPLLTPWGGSFGAFCIGLRPSSEFNALYIPRFLETTEYRHRVSDLASGSNINNLRVGRITEAPCRLAPRREQERIVAKRDACTLSRWRFSVLEESLRQPCSFRDKVRTSSSWDGDWTVQWNKRKSIKLDASSNREEASPYCRRWHHTLPARFHLSSN